MSMRTRQDGQPGNQGGNGTGTGDGNDGTLSDDQRREVEELVNGAVNGAITSQLARFRKSFTEEITKTLGETLNPISEQLKQFAERASAPPPSGEGGKAKKGELPPEVQEELARAKGQVAELQAMVEKEKRAREEQAAEAERQRQAALAKEARDALGAALRAKGVPEVQARAAVAMLTTEADVLGRNEEGVVIFKVPKGTGQARYIDEVPVEKGVEEWLKTDEGKAFLPARNAGGAGGLAARPQPTGNKGQDAKNAAVADLAKALLGG
jgi:hypothetical protein